LLFSVSGVGNGLALPFLAIARDTTLCSIGPVEKGIANHEVQRCLFNPQKQLL